MKKKTLIAIGLSMFLVIGSIGVSSADEGGGGGNQTWDSTACILSTTNGQVTFGSQCGAPGPGPCTTTTLCH